MASSIEPETVRHKSRLRGYLSRGLAGLGVAFYDMCLGRGDLTSCVPPAGPKIALDVHSAMERDLGAVACRRGRRTEERIASNKALGSSCIIAEHESSVVGYTWINNTVFEFLGARLRNLPEGAMCLHDVFVFPEYRGNGVFQQMLAAVFESGRAAGLHTVVCVVDRANAPAIAAFRRVGVRFRPAPILKLPGLAPMLLGVRVVGGGES